MADEPYRPLNQPLNHKGSNNTASAGGASLLASIFNLSNTTLGAGIVSIPFFFSQCGVVLGAAILILVGGLSALASFLLVASAELSGEWSYISVASAAYGRTGRTTVMAAILLLTVRSIAIAIAPACVNKHRPTPARAFEW
jgi:amino acid permease